MFNFYKPKYKFFLLRKFQDTMFVQKICVKESINEIVNINGRKYHIRIEQPAYIFKNYRVYLLDYDTGAQMEYAFIETPLKPNELDMIVGNKIIKELTQGVMDSVKDKIVWFVMGFLIGGLIAFGIMSQIMQGKIEELLSKPIIPIIP